MDEHYETPSLFLLSVFPYSCVVVERWEGRSRCEAGFLVDGNVDIVFSKMVEYFCVSF